jgi:hypothetical protein
MTQTEVHEDFLKYNPGSPGAVERGCTCPQEMLEENNEDGSECEPAS